jgi:hypothetical protein
MQEADFYCDGIFKLMPRWEKCISVLGFYFGEMFILKWNKWATFNIVMTSHLILWPREPYLLNNPCSVLLRTRTSRCCVGQSISDAPTVFTSSYSIENNFCGGMNWICFFHVMLILLIRNVSPVDSCLRHHNVVVSRKIDLNLLYVAQIVLCSNLDAIVYYQTMSILDSGALQPTLNVMWRTLILEERLSFLPVCPRQDEGHCALSTIQSRMKKNVWH